MNDRRPTDDLGIVRATTDDQPWRTVPGHVRATVREARTAEDVVAAMLQGPRSWPLHTVQELLHPASGAVAALVPTGPGARVLDLGTGWAALGPALGTLGADVVRADWSLDRLRFARLMHAVPGGVDVHIDVRDPLAATSPGFDVALADLGELAAAGLAPHEAERVLTEVVRAMSPSGRLVIGAEESVVRAVLRSSRGRERQASVRRLARRSGLRVVERYVALPHRAGWRVLVPGGAARRYLLEHEQRHGWKRGVARALTRGGGHRLLAPGAFVVLAREDHGPGAQRAASWADEGARALALSDARVGLAGPRSFVKIALSPDQRTALVAEHQRMRAARSTRLGPYVLEAEMVGTGDVVGIRTPVVRSRAVDVATSTRVVGDVLAALDDTDHGPVSDSVLWARLRSSRGQRDIAECEAQGIWRWADRTLSSRQVPLGPSHGDLHPENVLVPAGRPPVLVDWNRFEPRNPLVLDALYAAICHERARTGCSLADALGRAADDAIPGPLARRAHQVRGELGPLDAATLVLLDRVASYSLPRRRHKPWTLEPLVRAVEVLGPRLVE
ncbi:hypothetical protein [Cellulosimicrobium sp. NPDC055967]|uniref:hypothetical protein n=1 Tax=Cellulosimicrobium sp. NPDC055967 TaxID=3345670 RepID=UPI0035DE88EC